MQQQPIITNFTPNQKKRERQPIPQEAQRYTINEGRKNAGEAYWAVKDEQGKFTFFRWENEKLNEEYEKNTAKRRKLGSYNEQIMRRLDYMQTILEKVANALEIKLSGFTIDPNANQIANLSQQQKGVTHIAPTPTPMATANYATTQRTFFPK